MKRLRPSFFIPTSPWRSSPGAFFLHPSLPKISLLFPLSGISLCIRLVLAKRRSRHERSIFGNLVKGWRAPTIAKFRLKMVKKWHFFWPFLSNSSCLRCLNAIPAYRITYWNIKISKYAWKQSFYILHAFCTPSTDCLIIYAQNKG